jgi:hypothetical protein
MRADGIGMERRGREGKAKRNEKWCIRMRGRNEQREDASEKKEGENEL